MRIPPEEILDQIRATAIVELKKDFLGLKANGIAYLEKGSTGWITMKWTEDGIPSLMDLVGITNVANNTHRTVLLSWLSDGVEQTVFIPYTELNIVKKLKAWDS